jgi:hypothetical protein
MSKTLTVRAKHEGLMGGHRGIGATFTLDDEEQFAAAWMEPVGWTPKAKASATPSTDDSIAMLAEIAQAQAIFRDIRASLASIPGLSADLNLAEAVDWARAEIARLRALIPAEPSAKAENKK